ncbi:MAG: hypothetical protein UU24_C0004G0031, partial [Candidatus Nomurabacteria bacterium GW2011_GWA2_40_9]
MNQKINSKINAKAKIFLKSFFLLAIFAFSLQAVATWVAPTVAPIGGNVATPINSGNVNQVKDSTYTGPGTGGGLTVGFFQSNGVSSLNGSVNVGSATQFKINSTGNLIKINNVTYSWPSSAGANNSILTYSTTGGNLSWSTLASLGGMVNPMTAGGDIIYGGTAPAGNPTRLANGTAGQVLTSSGTTLAPTWASLAGAGSPFGVQNANKIFAGPATGVDATPTFRTMVIADLPNIDATSSKKLLGRYTASNGAPEILTISTGLSVDASGNLTATGGGSCTPTGTFACDGGNTYASSSLDLGTTNAQSFNLLTNGSNRLVIDSTGLVGIGAGTPQYLLDIGGDMRIKAQGDLRFADNDSSHYVGFQAPATVGTSLIWTLPADNVNGVLTNTNGTLTWGSSGGTGTVTSVGLTSGTSGTDVNMTGTNPITSSGTFNINIPTASSSATGKLSSTDWTTFNGKLSNITGLITAGTNITITGSGTSASPYSIAAAGGGTITGSGNTNRVAKFTGASSIGDSIVWDNGNVGINTLAAGDATNELTVRQGTNTTPATSGSYGFGLLNQASLDLTLGSDASNAYIQSWNNKELIINGQGNNVGIGAITTPGAKLDLKLGTDTDYFRIQRNSAAGRSQIVLATETAAEQWRIGMTGAGLTNFAFYGGTTNLTLERSGNSYFNTGNVGIGDTTPSNKLEITHGTSGNSGLRFTNLTSASTAGAVGTKVLSVNANGDVVLVTDATGGGGPSGTSGQTIRYDATNTAVANSNLYNNGTNVGINTASPGARLSVLGNLNVGTNYANIAGQANGVIIEGNVGIGTNAPGAKFDVVGTGRYTVNNLTSGSGLVLTSNNTGAATSSQRLLQVELYGVNINANQKTYGAYIANGHTGVGSINVGTQTSATGIGSGFTNIAGEFIATGATNNYAIIVPVNNGSVGIGTSAPTSLLHVNGTARLGTASSTSGSLIFNNNTNANTATFASSAFTENYTLTLPTAGATTASCLGTTGVGGVLSWVTCGGGGGGGTVTSVSVVSANGFAGTVANSTTTPAITLTTSVATGSMLKTLSNGLVAATAGTDYLTPFASQTAKTFFAAPNATNGTPGFRAIVASDIPTLNQNTTGSAGSAGSLTNNGGN